MFIAHAYVSEIYGRCVAPRAIYEVPLQYSRFILQLSPAGPVWGDSVCVSILSQVYEYIYHYLTTTHHITMLTSLSYFTIHIKDHRIKPDKEKKMRLLILWPIEAMGVSVSKILNLLFDQFIVSRSEIWIVNAVITAAQRAVWPGLTECTM